MQRWRGSLEEVADQVAVTLCTTSLPCRCQYVGGLFFPTTEVSSSLLLQSSGVCRGCVSGVLGCLPSRHRAGNGGGSYASPCKE